MTADAEASAQYNHRVETQHRSVGARVVTTLVPPPVKGANRDLNVTPVPFHGFDSVGSVSYLLAPSFSHGIPQLEFSRFDGTNPKIWIRRCENFFDVYETPKSHWVKLAAMNLGALLNFGCNP